MGEQIAARRNEAEVAWEPDRSPKGRYACEYRQMSQQLEVAPKPSGQTGPGQSSRPFEVDLVRIPPGKRLCPRHRHSVEWEYYIVLAGRGQMVQGDGDAPIPMAPGDHLLQPPGWVHTVENNGQEDLLYYVIANNALDETCFYPDSGKWAAGGKVFRMAEFDYYDGEE